jgi:methyl-accepting chemotaxis protein
MKKPRYDVWGAAVGVGLPLLATVLEALARFGSVAPAALARAHLAQPLLWIMDTTPLVLGALGRIIARQHEAIVRQSAAIVRQSEAIVALEQARRESFESTARQVAGAAQALLGSVSEFTAITAEVAAAVREAKAVMAQVSSDATSAALVADEVIGLAARPDRAGDGEALERSVAVAREIALAARRQEGAIERVLATMSGIARAADGAQASTQVVEEEARALHGLAASLGDAVKP